YDGYVMKLDKSTGALQWIKGYKVENRSTLLAKIKKTNSGYQVFSLVTDDFTSTNQHQCIWNLNTDGTVQNVRKLVIPGVQTLGYGWYPQADGGFAVVNGENNNNSDVLLSQVSAGGSIVWSKKYVRAGQQSIRNLTPSPEGGYVLGGLTNNGGVVADSNNVYIIRVDSLGNGGPCSGESTNDVTVINPSYTTFATSVSAFADVTINNPVITAGVVNFSPLTNTLCYYCKPKPTGSLR